MNRSQDNINVIKKLNTIIEESLPGFASRYFKANMDIKVPRTLLGYAYDLVAFFEFLETLSFDKNKMTIADLDKITPEIVEDYLHYSREYVDNGEVKTRSDAAIHRRYSSLSSFFTFFLKNGLVSRNPAFSVTPPKLNRQVAIAKTTKTNKDVIEFISKGSLEGQKGIYQDKTRVRDTAIVMLIAGTGIKLSELVNLDIEDVHLDTSCITIRNCKHARTIFISDSIAQALGQYLSERLELITEYGHDEALFISLKARRLSTRSVQYLVRKYSNAILDGEEYLTPEAMHKSFRNNMFSVSMNTAATFDLCGIDMKTLLRYYRPYIDDYESHKGQQWSS